MQGGALAVWRFEARNRAGCCCAALSPVAPVPTFSSCGVGLAGVFPCPERRADIKKALHLTSHG